MKAGIKVENLSELLLEINPRRVLMDEELMRFYKRLKRIVEDEGGIKPPTTASDDGGTKERRV